MTTTRHWSDALRWALESEADPAVAAADWLARDIDPQQRSAIALLTQRSASLEHLRQAKDAYKTMRIVGETAADRRMGARLYLASIAAALVVHNVRITGQSRAALERAMRAMAEDADVATELRTLAGTALAHLRASEID